MDSISMHGCNYDAYLDIKDAYDSSTALVCVPHLHKCDQALLALMLDIME